MPATEAQKQAARKWNEANAAERYDQLKILLDKGEKVSLKKHALEQGETLTDFVKRAIKEALERDKNPDAKEPVRNVSVDNDDTGEPENDGVTVTVHERPDYDNWRVGAKYSATVGFSASVHRHAEKMEETFEEFVDRAVYETKKRDEQKKELEGVADFYDVFTFSVMQHLHSTNETPTEFIMRAVKETVEDDKKTNYRKPKPTLEEVHEKWPILKERYNAGVVVEGRKKKVIKKKAANETEYKDGFSVQDEEKVEKKRDPKWEEANKKAWAAALRDEEMGVRGTRIYKAEEQSSHLSMTRFFMYAR